MGGKRESDRVTPEDFHERVEGRWRVTEAGCWEWTGSLNGFRYGQITIRRRNYKAHRLTYEYYVGPIPEGLQIDHLCRNHSCVNPAHLEPVTNQVNTLRGESLMAKQACRARCPQGHLLMGRNLYKRPNGSRSCRTCLREQQRARRRAQRA